MTKGVVSFPIPQTSNWSWTLFGYTVHQSSSNNNIQDLNKTNKNSPHNFSDESASYQAKYLRWYAYHFSPDHFYSRSDTNRSQIKWKRLVNYHFRVLADVKVAPAKFFNFHFLCHQKTDVEVGSKSIWHPVYACNAV